MSVTRLQDTGFVGVAGLQDTSFVSVASLHDILPCDDGYIHCSNF